MSGRLEAIAIGIVVFCTLFVLISGVILRRQRDRAHETRHDRIRLRVYVGGRLVLGPLTLNELATVVEYGRYKQMGETSILHIPATPGRIHPEYDLTVESAVNATF